MYLFTQLNRSWPGGTLHVNWKGVEGQEYIREKTQIPYYYNNYYSLSMIIAYFIFSFPSLSCLLEFTSSVTTQYNSWYASISWKNRRTNIKVVFEWPYSGTRINGISYINDSFWRSLICSNLKSAWNKIFRWLKRLSGPKSKLQEICRATKLSGYSFRDSTYSELLFIQNISPILTGWKHTHNSP